MAIFQDSKSVWQLFHIQKAPKQNTHIDNSPASLPGEWTTEQISVTVLLSVFLMLAAICRLSQRKKFCRAWALSGKPNDNSDQPCQQLQI